MLRSGWEPGNFFAGKSRQPMKLVHLLCGLIFLVLQGNAQIVHWPISQGGNDHYYEAVGVPGGVTWSQGSLAATNRGGYLATITSAAENDFVFALAADRTNLWNTTYGPWLGGFQPAGSPEPAGGWAWVTGEPFVFQNWAALQPNNSGGNEDRIQLGGSATIQNTWNDLAQNATNYARGYVVEYPKHPGAVLLDFETISGSTPVEGMTISNQFAAQFGISFRLANGGFPAIARKGAPQSSFNVSNVSPTLYDQLSPVDPRANDFGNFFLNDDCVPTGSQAIIMDFSSPVSRVSGFVLDVDGGDIVTITAYSDGGTNVVSQLVITKDTPEAGEGLSTPWSIVRGTPDIRTVRLTGGSYGYDNILTSFTPPSAQAAMLDAKLFAGFVIEGEVGRRYRIDYANQLTPTNWVTQTNITLPHSPYLYVDMTSTNSTQRFYRAVAE